MNKNMDAEYWKKINDLFHQALELEEPAQNDFLKKQCDEDAFLYEEVLKLLTAHQKAPDFIEQSPLEKAIDLISAEKDTQPNFIGQNFGVYKIVKEIGQGGMGSVFLGERTDEQFEKLVAIKIIKRGMDSDEVLRRFRNERQILANLEHPNIARLIDGGTTEDNRPYFVMEYIEGISVTKYAVKHRLSLNERLKLFRQVCSAVAYAHQRLVIHRDIKSSNIIVTADSVPKLLDFGIAKLISNEDEAVEKPITQTGFRMMTPEYASPEQLKGENVTTSTDIYSLGVVLFELLTGQRPFDKVFRKSGKIYQAVIETEPPKPSEIISEKHFTPVQEIETAENDENNKTYEFTEKTNPQTAITNPKSLRGDLDNIVLKALSKEQTDRYSSVEQFSEDIKRHLDGLPVIARPLSLKYRLGKFVGRNKIPVGLTALILLTLVGGIIATTYQSIRANREKDLAEKRFKDVRQLVKTVLFEYHDAIKDLPGATPVREKLVRDALEYLDNLTFEASGDLSLQKELAAAYERVGDVQGGTLFANLGDTKGAMESYEKSLKIRETILDQNPKDFGSLQDVALSLVKLSSLLLETGDTENALSKNSRALELFARLHKKKPADTEITYQLARTHGYIGTILHDRGEFDKAMEHYQNELKNNQMVAQSDGNSEKIRRAVSLAFEHIGMVHISKGDFQKALENNTEALNIRKSLAEEFPLNADYQRNLAVSYYNEGEILGNLSRFREALESYRKDVAIVEALAVKDPQNEQYRGDIAYGYVRFGDMEIKLNNIPKALEHYQKSESVRIKDVETDPENLWKKSSLIEASAKICKTFSLLKDSGKTDQKCSATYELMKTTVVEPTNALIRSFFAETYTNLGEAYLNISKPQNACDFFKQGFQIYQDLKNRGILGNPEAEKSQTLLRQIQGCDKDFRE